MTDSIFLLGLNFLLHSMTGVIAVLFAGTMLLLLFADLSSRSIVLSRTMLYLSGVQITCAFVVMALQPEPSTALLLMVLAGSTLSGLAICAEGDGAHDRRDMVDAERLRFVGRHDPGRCAPLPPGGAAWFRWHDDRLPA